MGMPERANVRAWVLTAMHIAAFAQLGVLAREYLAKLFKVHLNILREAWNLEELAHAVQIPPVR